MQQQPDSELLRVEDLIKVFQHQTGFFLKEVSCCG